MDAESFVEHKLTVSPTTRRFETVVPDASGFETTTSEARELEQVHRLMGEYATGARTAKHFHAERLMDALTRLILPHVLGPLHTPALRLLALLAKSGLRVIITTHSEWVLEELANIVRRSELRGAREAGNDVGAALDRHEAGAWLFQPKQRPKGSVVTEIELAQAGLYPTGFEEVAAALHNDWAEISSRCGAPLIDGFQN